MRWLVVGSRGQLGSDLVSHLESSRPDDLVVGMSRPGLDVRDPVSIRRVMEMVDPDFVVNCTAYTDVDAAESDESGALAVNAIGALNLASACSDRGTRMIHVSTDYVFPGGVDRPYVESDPVRPLSAYGRSKLAGEVLVSEELGDGASVVRTSWLYGSGRRNFVRAMLEAEATGGPVTVVGDQVGSPTWTGDLCAFIESLALDAESGLFHFANSGSTSWFDFAAEVFRCVDGDPSRLEWVPMTHFWRPAARPSYSPLATERGAKPRHWSEALSDALATILEVR